mgnify:CR=1 FL=1
MARCLKRWNKFKNLNFYSDKIEVISYPQLKNEKELIKIYTNKLDKYLSQNTEKQPILLIKEILETPLEGEMAKHNKIKVITIRIVKKETNFDVIFYVKYKQCSGYNKQVAKLANSYSRRYT